VDTVITDPPYNSGGRTNGERRGQTARGKYVSGDAQHDLADFTGDNRDQRSYTLWLSLILAQCLRISVNGAHLLVFTDWRQLPATSDALQVAGWTWQGTISWYKPVNRPRRGGFRSACEYILWGSNGPYDNQREIYMPGLLSASQPSGRQRRHITQKPVEGLLAELIHICRPGGVVLDPCTGSGSTGEAALTSGRSFIGIELSDSYYSVAVDRLAALQTPVD
jgi:site-specific DNA-methyltransferase (adenine-specific)